MIHKFGGASIQDASHFKNVGEIITNLDTKQILVVSAIGKTTNALETVALAHFNQELDKARSTFDQIKSQHCQILSELLQDDLLAEALIDINDACVEVEWLIEDDAPEDYDYLYDQLVSTGEILSTKILYYYLKSLNLNTVFLDARDYIITDNNYRSASVFFDKTNALIQAKIPPLFNDHDYLIIQGFIGTTTENFTTTLGREGSDYTAAIFAGALNSSMTVWKDVPGIMTGDPKKYEQATLIPTLSYREAVEMCYYGAKVIHPKTIQPIQQKGIPLFVKSYKQASVEGSVIKECIVEPAYNPIVVHLSDISLLKIKTKDFSFVSSPELSILFNCLQAEQIKVHLMRNSAVSFFACVTDDYGNMSNCISKLGDNFIVEVEQNLELVTIRHDDGSIQQELTKNREIVFEEIYGNSNQIVLR